jgi:SAM-dependent methyltransferase
MAYVEFRSAELRHRVPPNYWPKMSEYSENYWSTIGRYCIDFLMYCAPSDWMRTSYAIAKLIKEFAVDAKIAHVKNANEAVVRNSSDNIKCLDYGAGFLTSTRTIASVLATEFDLVSKWDFFETDAGVCQTVTDTISPACTVDWHSGVSGIFSNSHEKCYDVVTLLHSIYYVDDVEKLLNDLKPSIKPNGIVVILRLKAKSPFYLDFTMVPDNGSYLDSYENFTCIHKENRRSRFFPPLKATSSPKFMRGMRLLLTRGRYSRFVNDELASEFLMMWQKNFSRSKLDLKDEILVYRLIP